MKRKVLIITTIAVASSCLFSSCNSGTSGDNSSISSDSVKIAAGEMSFNKNCSGCHNFRQDGIGPQLSGITGQAPVEWIQHFIKNSSQLIASGDERANVIFLQYNKSAMPSFAALQDEELGNIIAFIHTHKEVIHNGPKKNGNEVENPIPEKIPLSGLVVDLKPFAEFPHSNDSAPKARITKLDFQPSTGTLFVNDLRGKLYKLKDGKPEVFMDMAKLKPKFINEPGLATGFGSFAFHPEFNKNGILYTTHSEAPGSGKADFAYSDTIRATLQWVLTEWKIDNPKADTFSGTGRELMRINYVTGIHGVQEITFNPLSKPGSKDYGLLYIGAGDGGSVEHGYPFLAHSKERIWGTVLRIDPMGKNSANGQYGIPADNPFAKGQGPNTVREIYAYGFRNPHRITWTKSGQMLVSNVGQGHIESLYLVKPGNDHGWPIREGNFVSSELDGNQGNIYPLPANDSIYKITYPVAEFDHDEGAAITGGFEYTGSTIPPLKGKFLFGDIPSGRLFYINIADIKQGWLAPIQEWKIQVDGTPHTLKEACGNDRVDLHFGKDINGELYILTKADGKVYKLSGATIKP